MSSIAVTLERCRDEWLRTGQSGFYRESYICIVLAEAADKGLASSEECLAARLFLYECGMPADGRGFNYAGSHLKKQAERWFLLDFCAHVAREEGV